MSFNISRFKDIEKREYEIEVITPMFLGGADPKKAELRVPSIKGMLRFWWRAIIDISDTKKLYEKESEIFGNSECKSKLSINIKEEKLNIKKELFYGKRYKITKRVKPKNDSINSQGFNSNKIEIKEYELDILHYLVYGTYRYEKGKGNIIEKEYINPGSVFKLEFSIHKKYYEEVEKAFRYLISFGGLGAKNRNGFGSIFCRNIKMLDKFEDNGTIKEFTSFSNQASVIKFNLHNSWQDALSEIGLVYREARLSLEPKHKFQKRAYIAKPIEAKGERIDDYIKENRHSKTYFLHVNKVIENAEKKTKYQGQILFLPYNYRPTEGSNESKSEYDSINLLMKNKIQSLAGGSKWL